MTANRGAVRRGKTNGSITIGACAATAGLLLLMAVLIDYSRIAAFHHRLEGLAQSGVRSVLSAYDEELYERYGLFGKGGSDGGELLKESVELGLDSDSRRDSGRSDNESHLRLLDMKLSSSTLQPALFLGDRRIFQRQLLQEMKYKAPIDLTLELIDKITPLSHAMGEAKATVDKLQDLEKLFDQRQQALESMLELQEAAEAAVRQSGLDSVLSAAHGSSGSSLSSISSHYPQYVEWIAMDEAAARALQEAAARPSPSPGATPQPLPVPPSHGAEIAAYESRLTRTGDELRSAGIHMSKHQEYLRDARQELELARGAEQKMAAALQETRRQDSSGEQNGGDDGSSVIPTDTGSVLDDTTSMLLGEEWFAEAEGSISHQDKSFSALELKAESMGSLMMQALQIRAGSMALPLSDGERALTGAWSEYAKDWMDPGSAMLEQRGRIEQSDSSRAERKAQKKKAGSLWKEARSMLSGIEGLAGSEEILKEFREVESLYKSNMDYNQSLLQEEEAVDPAEEPAGSSPDRGAISNQSDADEAVKESQSMAAGVFSGMGALLAAGGERLFAAQYAAQRFTYTEPRLLKSSIFGGEVSAQAGKPPSEAAPGDEGPQLESNQGEKPITSLEHQEMEYILYGFGNPAANLSAAYGELFAMRLAIRTMEGLLKSKGAGHPLLVLAMAAVYGLKEAIGDIRSMLDTGEAPLSAYLQVKLTYLDYLRLFYLLHGSGDGQLSRMIAVIELRTGSDLSAVPTGAIADLRLSLSLWFLPGAAKLLGRSGLLRGEVTGGRYETTAQAGWSY